MNRNIQRLAIGAVTLFGLLTITACGGPPAQIPTVPPAANSSAAVDSASSSVSSSQADTTESVALAYDPKDGSLLKADNAGLLRWRTDTGWRKVNIPQVSTLSAIVVNPDNPTTYYASGPGVGVIRSNDSGNTWQAINTGLPSLDITALAIHSFRRDTVFAWMRGKGVARTEDGGANWKQVPDRGPRDTNVHGLVFSTLPGSMNTGWLYASTPTGAYMSMDCFCGWRAAGNIPANPMIRSVAVDPQTPARVYAAGPAGLFRSDNGGLDWGEPLTGLAGKPLAVTLDPKTPQTVFAVLIDGSVWKSPDGATTWQPLKAA